MKDKSVLLLKFCSTVRTVTLYLFHVLRANYCKKGCIDFIIDHIEFLQQLSNTVHQMISVSHKLVYTYNNVECTVGDVAAGFPPPLIFSQAGLT